MISNQIYIHAYGGFVVVVTRMAKEFKAGWNLILICVIL